MVSKGKNAKKLLNIEYSNRTVNYSNRTSITKILSTIKNKDQLLDLLNFNVELKPYTAAFILCPLYESYLPLLENNVKVLIQLRFSQYSIIAKFDLS